MTRWANEIESRDQFIMSVILAHVHIYFCTSYVTRFLLHKSAAGNSSFYFRFPVRVKEGLRSYQKMQVELSLIFTF